MKTLQIKDKLKALGVSLDEISLGDFDRIGEFTAKRERNPNEPNYHKYGHFYRANYERGILVYYLIRKLGITSMLEVGFGRGYTSFCAAKAFHDGGIKGKIVTVDPQIDEKFLNALLTVFPREWFGYLEFGKAPSAEALPKVFENNASFDLVYIDGDHSYEGVKADWLAVKDRFTKACLFDDYHLPTKDDPGIQCKKAIDEAESDCDRELIIMDRRIFADERGYPDELIDYGQVLFTKPGVKVDSDEW